jgi:NAD(P)-dependent dehydrogenase (short-subunit alcohol dehydrogenase family)
MPTIQPRRRRLLGCHRDAPRAAQQNALVGALDGRTAIVTGGGRGLGAAIARVLADERAHVGVLARSASDVRAVAAEVGGTPLVADVTDAARLATTLQRFGAADVVVANAGVVWPVQRFVETDLADWEKALAINVVGVARVVHAMLPGMLHRGWGRIVTISSGAATPPGMSSANAYSTSKAALDMFTLHLARELDGSGVTVNAVRPGIVDTPMQTFMRSLPREQVGDAFHDRFHGVHERGELVPPERSARFVVDMVLSGETGRVVDIRDHAS